MDSRKLFEFVDTLYAGGDQWVFPFELAHDITLTLRTQLAKLFGDALQLRKRMRQAALPPAIASLSGTSLRIALEKPSAWEYKLLLSVIKDEMSAAQELKGRWSRGLGAGSPKALQVGEFIDWLQGKNHELLRIIQSATRYFEYAFQVAIGKPAEAGDAEQIVEAGRGLVGCYIQMLRWGLSVQDAALGQEFERVLELQSRWPGTSIDRFEHFVELYENGMARFSSGEKVTIEHVVKFDLPEEVTQPVFDELQRLQDAGLL